MNEDTEPVTLETLSAVAFTVAVTFPPPLVAEMARMLQGLGEKHTADGHTTTGRQCTKLAQALRAASNRPTGH
jgi:hypothetical protein